MSKKNDSVCTIPLCFAYLFGGGFYASSGPGAEKMAGYMTTIRIYNDPKDKRTFIRQMVQDFQEYEDISDFKASVFELTKEYFSDNVSLQDVNIGFIGASNQNSKSFVYTSPQVYDAYITGGFTQTQRASAVHRTA